MKKIASLKIACMVFVFCVATVMLSLAQDTFTTLVNFDRTNGYEPSVVLTQGADGNFYGATYEGGVTNAGTVFKMSPAGTLTTLYNFCSQTNCADGAGPVGSLVQAADGDFYGTTEDGGAHGLGGTVFRITSTGKLTTLYSFCALANCADGEFPSAGLVQATNGKFYGVTASGGVFSSGTVFEITLAGELTTLHSFNGTDGYNPEGALVQSKNGEFYGTTAEGQGAAGGTFFEMSANGNLTTLFTFYGTKYGFGPNGALIQAADGNFYGVTGAGGNGTYCDIDYGCGTVFKITPAGNLTTLYNFCSQNNCADAAAPNGPLVQGMDGNFYGTTYGDTQGNFYFNQGTAFEITPGGTLTTLYTFCSLPDCADGASPIAGLLEGTNGTFYGTTYQGGANNDGTVFSLSTGFGPFVRTQPTSAKESASVGIFGQGFTRSSMVQFGGVQATVVKVSGTFLEAKVPAGALTGSVTVTTNGTTLTSNQQFRVTPQVLKFSPPNGPVGTQVTINGVGFTQTTGVGFGDNVPAQFTVNSDTQITATVPTGAKTGPIGVVTKGGIAISSVTFTVN